MKKLLSILLVLLLSFGALAEHMGAPYEFRESHVTIARIASGVTEIAEGAYYYCKELKTLEVPATVTRIGDYAFDHCENLTELTIPDSVREIGECAFNYCMRIASLDLGNGVKTLGSYAFSCCFSLRQATIPQSVTSIGDYAFYNCRALDTLYIYGSVQSIGASALEGCPRLTVYTPATSPAAAYCTQNGIKWVAIEEPELPQPTESQDEPQKTYKDMSQEYIKFVRSLIEDEEVRKSFDSWRNKDNNYKNTGHLLLEFTQDSLKTKKIDKDSSIWVAKDVLWGISSLGLSTLNDLFRYVTKNGDGVTLYRNVLEESYLIYANLAFEKVESFVEPWVDAEKYMSQAGKGLSFIIEKDLNKRVSNFEMYRTEDVLWLKKELDKSGKPNAAIDALAREIKAHEVRGTISSTGSLILDGAKLIGDLNSYAANKALFLAALASASDEILYAIDMLQETTNDTNVQNAIYKFRKEYKAAVSDSIAEFAKSDTFWNHLYDITDYGISLFNYFQKIFGSKLTLKTNVWKILDGFRKDNAFSDASLLVSTTKMATDLILGTSDTQKNVKGIDAIINLKETMNKRIDLDLIRFEHDQTFENAKIVITDIKLLKSFQILGEQYALKFYEQLIEKRSDLKRSDAVIYFQHGNMSTTQYEKRLSAILEEERKQKDKFTQIVSCTNVIIDSLCLPTYN